MATPPIPQPQPIQQPYEIQHYPQTTTTTNPLPQPYDPSSISQIQSYDPASYYASYPQQQQQPQYDTTLHNPDYSSSTTYYYPGYSASYDPNSIYPPGVDSQQTHNYYYPPQSYYQPAQPVYGGGSQGGYSTRGRGRGRGRGGGGSRGKPATPAAPKQPPQMAWCELCRVDCNTQEILDKHKSGKKHHRNLKVFEELQTTTKPITVVNPQVSMTQPQSEVSNTNPFPSECVAAPSQELHMADHAVAQPFGDRGGLKRKTNAGRDGKWIRTADGSKRFVPANKMVPILCELCNVKCESEIVYASHVAGKKHLLTLKRYQGHKETFGEGVEALYPTPAIPVIPQTDQQAPIPNPVSQDAPLYPVTHQQGPIPVSQDAQALASMMLSQQNLPNPEAAKAALAELLNQHGIHDAQTLLVQLVPYLLTQPQVPELALLAGSELNAPSQLGQGPNISTEAEDKNGDIKNDGSDTGAGKSNKPDDGPLEAGKDGEVSAEPDNGPAAADKV